jgi:hypothetical protein
MVARALEMFHTIQWNYSLLSKTPTRYLVSPVRGTVNRFFIEGTPNGPPSTGTARDAPHFLDTNAIREVYVPQRFTAADLIKDMPSIDQRATIHTAFKID